MTNSVETSSTLRQKQLILACEDEIVGHHPCIVPSNVEWSDAIHLFECSLYTLLSIKHMALLQLEEAQS
jgi:hypothetical protein